MPTSSEHANSERAMRHHEYYIEGADLIIRVRVFTIEHRAVCSDGESTGGEYPFPCTSLFPEARLGVLSKQTPPSTIPWRCHQRLLR